MVGGGDVLEVLAAVIEGVKVFVVTLETRGRVGDFAVHANRVLFSGDVAFASDVYAVGGLAKCPDKAGQPRKVGGANECVKAAAEIDAAVGLVRGGWAAFYLHGALLPGRRMSADHFTWLGPGSNVPFVGSVVGLLAFRATEAVPGCGYKGLIELAAPSAPPMFFIAEIHYRFLSALPAQPGRTCQI